MFKMLAVLLYRLQQTHITRNFDFKYHMDGKAHSGGNDRGNNDKSNTGDNNHSSSSCSSSKGDRFSRCKKTLAQFKLKKTTTNTLMSLRKKLKLTRYNKYDF